MSVGRHVAVDWIPRREFPNPIIILTAGNHVVHTVTRSNPISILTAGNHVVHTVTHSNPISILTTGNHGVHRSTVTRSNPISILRAQNPIHAGKPCGELLGETTGTLGSFVTRVELFVYLMAIKTPCKISHSGFKWRLAHRMYLNLYLRFHFSIGHNFSVWSQIPVTLQNICFWNGNVWIYDCSRLFIAMLGLSLLLLKLCLLSSPSEVYCFLVAPAAEQSNFSSHCSVCLVGCLLVDGEFNLKY